MTESEPTAPVAPEEENGLALDEEESKELQEIFSTVFPQYLVPLEELVGQILDGRGTAETLAGLRGAIAPLASAAASVGVSQLKDLLEEFGAIIEEVGDGGKLDEEARDRVIDVFYRLKEAVQNIGAGSSPAPADSAAPHRGFVSQLSAVPGIEAGHIQRVLAAGIASAQQVRDATSDEIAAVTGLGEELARRITEAFAPARTTSTKKPDPEPGGAGFGSGGGPSEPPKSAGPGQGLAPPFLEARLALIALVRERIHLEECLEREQRAVQRANAEADQLGLQVMAARVALRRAREELAHEEQTTEHQKSQVDRLRSATQRRRRPNDTTAEAVAELRGQLHRLKERARAR